MVSRKICFEEDRAATRSGRNFENHENHGLGHVEGPSWSKNQRLRCAAHNVLKEIWLVETVYTKRLVYKQYFFWQAVSRQNRHGDIFITFDPFIGS